MRILNVVQGYFPAIGGTERVIQKLSENLVACYADEVTVYTTTAYNCELFWSPGHPQLPAGVETINAVRVRRFPVFNRLSGLLYWLANGSYRLRLPYNDWLRTWYGGPLVPGLSKAIRQSGAEIIVASSFPLWHMHQALRAGHQAGIPVVFIGGIHPADDYGFNRPMIYQDIKQADAYIAYTSFEKNYLIEKGIDADKIAVTGVGVDIEPFEHADAGRIKRDFGWGDAPVVAFVGQQVPHKGIDILMAAMPQVWQVYPNACVLIAGSQTTYSQVIRHWIDQLPENRQRQVAMMSNFAEAEKADIFAAADVVVYPSAFESFGIVFLEAWRASKPVVGIRKGAVPSVITEGKDGILIRHRDVNDLARALLTLLKNPEIGSNMGELGRQKVLSRYTWDIVTRKCRDVFNRFV